MVVFYRCNFWRWEACGSVFFGRRGLRLRERWGVCGWPFWRIDEGRFYQVECGERLGDDLNDIGSFGGKADDEAGELTPGGHFFYFLGEEAVDVCGELHGPGEY